MAFKPFKTLLFGFAFSPSLKANVYEATRLANYFEAALILLHVGEKTKENMIKSTPLQRLGTPQDIANTVYYLLSDQSNFTTGQTLVTDGGKISLP